MNRPPAGWQVCFGLVLSLLHPDAIAEDRLTPAELQAAMLGAIAMLREMLSQAGIETGFSTFNFALTDGQTVVVTRRRTSLPLALTLALALALPFTLT